MIQRRRYYGYSPWREEAPRDYGMGRTCQVCGCPVNRYSRDDACNLHRDSLPSPLARTHLRKLTMEDVQEIRAEGAEGATPTELAERYGVARKTITQILRGLTYKVKTMEMIAQ